MFRLFPKECRPIKSWHSRAMLIDPRKTTLTVIAPATRKERSFSKEAEKKAQTTGGKIRASIKNAFSSAGKRIKKTDKTDASSGKLESEKQVEKHEHPKTEIPYERPKEPSIVEAPILVSQDCKQVPPDLSDVSDSSMPSSESQMSDEMEIECFICENLIHCEVRRHSVEKLKGIVRNSKSCRFAAELSRKNPAQ